MPDTPTTILVVDDTEGSRYSVSRILQKAAFTVKEAATGQDALRLASEQPDLVILDINLPDMNGYEVCRRLKADPATASIPVLHLSASFVESDSRATGLEQGADGYLTYPIEPRELIANVEALLRARRAEREANRQREMLRLTLHSIGEGVIATDNHGRVTFLNAVASSMIGQNQNQAIGKHFSSLYRLVMAGSRTSVDDPISEVLRERHASGVSHHLILVAHDGSERVVENSAAPIRDESGRIVGVIVVFRDMTEREKLEQALRERAEQLLEIDRRKDEFLAMLAHELRNPLAPLQNALHVVRTVDPAPVPEVQAARDIMERQVEQLTRLVDDLLDMSRISGGKIRLRQEKVDLAVIVARAVEGARPTIEGRQHDLQISLPDQPITVEADLLRLAQVILNLLTNAAKYTPERGRIRLIVEKNEEAVYAQFPLGQAVVRVQDTGVGLAPEMLAKVFDLFTQADRSIDRAEGGLGIGLTLVRRLTELHGGSVEAFSPGTGQGSEFVVRLPLAEAAGTEVHSSVKTPAAMSTPRRILVVDDNRDSADTLTLLLRLLGHDVRSVYDGRLAVTTAANYRPDIVLLDIGLPGMNGYEVCARLRADPTLKGLTILALTGFGQEEDKKRSQEKGFDAHLIKPVDLDVLREFLVVPSS